MDRNGAAEEVRDSRLFKLLRRWLGGSKGMRSKHGANLALDILAANGVAELAIVRGDGRRIHISTRDKVIASSVVRLGSFGRETMAAFAEAMRTRGLLPSALTFVNVGANIGTACLNAYDFGFRRIVAIEPEPENFRLLRLNLDGLAGADVRLVQAAIGESPGHATLHRHRSNMGAHSLVERAGAAGGDDGIDVAVRRLDEIADDGRPIVLFADVEGYEPQVLRGGANAIERDCRAMVLEITPAKYAPSDADDLCQRLRAFSGSFELLSAGTWHPTAELPALLSKHRKGHFDIALFRGGQSGRQP